MIRRFLPPGAREVVSGDLDEIWRSGRVTRLRWWWLAALSIASCWTDVVRNGVESEDLPEERSARGETLMGSLLQDLGYGARSLRRSPGFAAAAIVTIALGIGVNTATFGIVNVLALKPLVYKDPDRVAFVLGWNNLRQQRRFNVRLADALDVGAQAPSISGRWNSPFSPGGRSTPETAKPATRSSSSAGRWRVRHSATRIRLAVA